MEGRRIDIRGTVQGVGFRPWVYRLAHELGICGRVRNDAAGVVIEAFAQASALDRFVERLRHEGPRASHVAQLATQSIPVEGARDFVIVRSQARGEKRLAIPPDLATCDSCITEIFDPANRRYRYPFTNCTDCGPRFTIARGVPYDRPLTTMSRFVMCEACAREYHDPTNRRFHAQPNACPVCGPRLRFLDGDGGAIEAGDAIDAAAAALGDGAIVALKGLGGYHLACDATWPEMVTRLRARKHREAKPFAVMVRDLDAARALVEISPEAARLLTSVERPIVLLPRKDGARIAGEVAPDNPLLGVFLPYTPLHHLLLHEVGRPLVMTSANLTDEPIVHRDDDALSRLRGIADRFLVHDREIAARCDDSVARITDGRPMMLRRSRGWVPAPFAVARRFSQPILAAGGDLKNAPAIASGDAVWLAPHVGDLENVEAMSAFEGAIAKLERLLGVKPELIAHDFHPGYHSTGWALRQRGNIVAVQHHHAHVASVMAEARLDGPVLGFAWDGTGWGTDGTAWGGELLIAEYARFTRAGSFRALALPGGERAIHEPWRIALAMLDDAGVPGERFFPRDPTELMRRLIKEGLAPRARGIGRWFDAVGSLVLGLRESRFEGEVAMRLDFIADPDERERYPFDLDGDEIDLRPMVRSLVNDLARPAVASARFHNTLIAAAVEQVRRVGVRLPVVLSGGCFQNARLAEGIARELRCAGHEVHLPSKIPPGDGGLALGQAVVADAIVRGKTCA